MLKQTLLGLALVAFSASSLADEWLKSLPDFELQDQHGVAHLSLIHI